jgi:hypothetical protein
MIDFFLTAVVEIASYAASSSFIATTATIHRALMMDLPGRRG